MMKSTAKRSSALAAAAVLLLATVAIAQPLGGPLLQPDPGLTSNLLGAGVEQMGYPTRPGSSLGSLGEKLDRGSVGVGVNVAPLGLNVDNSDRASATSIYRLADTDLRTTAIGFDLKLRWPSLSASDAASSPLQPYVSLGPALVVVRGDDTGLVNTRLLNRSPFRSDASMSLGMKSALGLTWQMSKDASLFGEYRVVQDRLGLPGRPAGDHGGADLFYGFSLRF
jgi:hypothetical protein